MKLPFYFSKRTTYLMFYRIYEGNKKMLELHFRESVAHSTVNCRNLLNGAEAIKQILIILQKVPFFDAAIHKILFELTQLPINTTLEQGNFFKKTGESLEQLEKKIPFIFKRGPLIFNMGEAILLTLIAFIIVLYIYV